MKLSTVLLLEAANVVHIDRVELALSLLLVGRELLVVHRLKTDSRVVANTDNEHTAALLSALLVLLIREGDVDLRDVIGGGRRRVGVGKHRTAVFLIDDEDAGTAVMCCLDGESAVVGEALAVAVVVRRQTVLLGLKDLLVLETGAAEKEEDGHENEAEKNKAEKAKHEVDHAVV